MTNPKDSGRYDAITQTWIDQNVQIDFAWGNIPMQPNDDRGENTLNPALDSHEIAVFSYEGFPAFIQGYPYDDTKPNIEMPNFVGVLPSAITGMLNSVGGTGSWSVVDTSTAGATAGNNGKVKSQNPAAGTVVNFDQGVEVVTFDYVAPPPASNPIAGIRADAGLNPDERYMFLLGRTSGLQNGDYITISDCDVTDYNRPYQVRAVVNDDAFNTGGTKVTIANGLITSIAPSTGHGTWVTGVH